MIHAAAQVAKEFHLIPRSVLNGIGVDESQLNGWRIVLRAASDAVDELPDDVSLHARVTESDLVVSVPKLGGVEAVLLTIPEAHRFLDVAQKAVQILGARELFLRTGFSADEVLGAASTIAAAVDG